MKILLLIAFLFISVSFAFSQPKIENEVDTAYQNAKKGVYWALANIPLKKPRLDNDLIIEDKLCASVKLDKEINGIRIISVGYNSSNEVTIKIFKSFDNLVKEGYIKDYNNGDLDLLKKE